MALTADKAFTLVIMDKDMYIKKCMGLINDEEAYKECRCQTRSIQSKVVKQLLYLKIHLDKILKNSATNVTLQVTTASIQDCAVSENT